jgi:hypothetical protein
MQAASNAGSGGLTHSEQARVGSGLCYYHWTHGSRASKSVAPQLAQGRLNAVAPGFLIHVMDQISGWHFLVDTGAAFSIIPHSYSLSASG